MDSLAERELDPLQILIDAAHDHGMEFIASLRAPAYLGLDESFTASEETQGIMAEQAGINKPRFYWKFHGQIRKISDRSFLYRIRRVQLRVGGGQRLHVFAGPGA